MELNLQQLAAVINDEDELIKEVMDRKLYSRNNIHIEEIIGTYQKMRGLILKLVSILLIN